MSQSIYKLRIITVQFPFIPVFIKSDLNTLSEPEGRVNYWISGGERVLNKKILTLYEILQYATQDKKISQNFQNSYLEWLSSIIDEILEIVVNKENPDIIILPEYSVPIEISEEIKKILIKWSKKRCIIAGIGSINNEYNKFVVLNDGALTICKKFCPNPDEIKLGIKSGDGPFLHKIKLHYNKEPKVIYGLIPICSDFLSLGTFSSDFNDLLSEEKKLLNCEDFDIIMIPAFTKKIQDFYRIAKTFAIRKYTPVVISNCSYLGGSSVFSYITEVNDEELYYQIKKGQSGYISAEILFPPLNVSKPKSKSIGLKEKKEIILQNTYKINYFLFDSKTNQNKQEFLLETPSFIKLISDRLSKAILFACITLSKNLSSEIQQKIVNTITLWIRLQEKILISGNIGITLSHQNLSEIIIALVENFILSNPYMKILNILENIITNEEYQKCIQQLKKYLENEDLPSLYLFL